MRRSIMTNFRTKTGATRFSAALLCLFLAGPGSDLAIAQPDLILHNGKIVTVDEEFSSAEALAVQSDRITAVGTDSEVRALATPTTQLVDLEGKTVLPGLIDSHTHPLRGAVRIRSHRA